MSSIGIASNIQTKSLHNGFKLALITGASSGLGKALAYTLAAKGIPLLLTARSTERLLEVQAQVKVPVTIFAADLTRPEEREGLLLLMRKRTPDLIINCAGLGFYGEVLNQSDEESQAMIEVNVQALVEISIEAARILKVQGEKGTIVNIASAAAFLTYPTFCIYAATKAFVNQFSQGFDAELRPQGIRVLSSCPGQIATDFQNRASKGFYQKKALWAMSAEEAAGHIWQQIEKGHSQYTFDWRSRVAILVLQLFPAKLRHFILRKTLEPRIQKKRL